MRFILIDRILDMEPGQQITATKTFSPDEEFFRDHFPGFPVVPGVLLTEMMGQAAAKCLEAEPITRGKPMLARITNANFREWVRPGQPITVFASIRSSRPQFAIAECQNSVEGRQVASAELFFTFMPREHFIERADPLMDAFLARTAESERPPQS